MWPEASTVRVNLAILPPFHRCRDDDGNTLPATSAVEQVLNLSRDYEEDHLISLELGGSDSSEKNLWPQPYEKTAKPYTGEWGAKVKDGLENELGRRICLAATNPEHLSLRAARTAIKTDWMKAYHDYVCGGDAQGPKTGLGDVGWFALPDEPLAGSEEEQRWGTCRQCGHRGD